MSGTISNLGKGRPLQIFCETLKKGSMILELAKLSFTILDFLDVNRIFSMYSQYHSVTWRFLKLCARA